jgi:translocation and assembly module TamA
MTTCRRRFAGCVRAGALAAALTLAACGGGGPELSGADFDPPGTAVEYAARVDGMPDEAMTELAEESLSVFRQQDDGAYSLALLRRRAENDLQTVQQILRSQGYYNGSAEVAVDEISQDEFDALDKFELGLPSVSDLMFWKNRAGDGGGEEPAADGFALVVISVDPGAQFTLERHEFQFLDPQMAAAVPPPLTFGSPVGGPAEAVPIVAAEAAAVDLLQGGGYPYAEAVGRDAVADLALATLEVDSQLRSGPSGVFGPVSFEGIEEVREDYLRTYIPWQPGEVVDQDLLRELQQALLATDLFNTLLVEIPPDPPPDPQPGDGPVPLPVKVTVDERPFRTVAAGGGYSTGGGNATNEGPYVIGRFEHRNLWGENEQLSVEANVGLELQQLLIGYREPQYLAAGQDLLVGLALVREEADAFDQLRATLTAGLRRRLTPEWVVGYGGLVEASRITEDGVTTEAYLAGIPTFAEFDDTDDLLDPTEGARARFKVTPLAGTLDSDMTAFLEVDTGASAYWDVLNDEAYILAGRGRLASVIAGDFDDVPANRRLYAGGGGSVRGYRRRFVGPLDAQNDPVGGLSALETSVELRARLWQEIGGVLFVDAGSVSRESYPDFEEGVQVAVGTGVRYFSPAGPIRLDLAFPVNGRDADDFFQFYFSIGQAF